MSSSTHIQGVSSTATWLVCCTLACVFAATVTALSFGFGSWRESEVLQPGRIIAGDGYAFRYQLPRSLMPRVVFGRHADHNQSPSASNLVLFENGKPLLMAHSLHHEIRKIGSGHYSHWQSGGPFSRNDWIIFSTSDNSDPRTNGRTYSVEYAPEPGWIAILSVLMFCAMSLLGLYRAAVHDPSERGWKLRRSMEMIGRTLAQSQMWAVLVVVTGGYVFIYYAIQMPAVPLLTLDSGSYLTANDIVPLGFWCFASVVSSMSGSLAALPAAHILVWAGSVLVLYLALCKVTRFRCIAALAALSLMLLGTVTKFSMIALPETLFVSVLVLHIASVLLTLESPTRKRIMMVGVTAFLPVFLRPAGLFVLVCTVALALFLRGIRRSLLVFGILPMLGFYVLATFASYAYRGPAETLLPLAFFPHVSHLFKAEYVPEMPSIAQAVDESLANYRAGLGAQPTGRQRARYEMDNFNRASFAVQGALRRFGLTSREEIIRYFRAFAWAAISHHPIDYAVHIGAHASFAWADMLFYPINTVAWMREHYSALEQDHDVASRKAREYFLVPRYRFSELVTGNRSLAQSSAAVDYVPNFLASLQWLGPLVGITSAIVLVASLVWGRKIPRLAALGYIGALMHSAILLVAATTTVIPRYIDPLAPLAIIFLALLLDWAVRSLWEKVLRRMPHPVMVS